MELLTLYDLSSWVIYHPIKLIPFFRENRFILAKYLGHFYVYLIICIQTSTSMQLSSHVCCLISAFINQIINLAVLVRIYSVSTIIFNIFKRP